MKKQTPINAHELLMPLPKCIQEQEGAFCLHMGMTIGFDPLFSDVATLATEQLGGTLGGEDILFKLGLDMGDETYHLSVNRTQIVIQASTSSGAFCALQTLRQLALANEGIIPCCLIEDEPAFPWRGFMLDTSRHYFSVAFIKKLIDVASMHHLNRFHWHLTDDQGWRIEIPGYAKLISVGSRRTRAEYFDGREHGGFYTDDEILSIQEYAHQRHMMVIPEIETPGHASALLAAYPEFGCTGGPYKVQNQWGIFEEVMCAGNDKLMHFLEVAIAKIAKLFTDPYIHIGGDECPQTAWETCPKCQQRMKKEGITSTHELQSWMTTKISKMVEKEGKYPIGWDEVLEGAERYGLPPSLIVMSWRGEAGGIEASNLGHEVIMCPNSEGCYFSQRHLDSIEEPGVAEVATIKKVAEYSPVPHNLAKEAQSKILGGQGNLWTELIASSRLAEYMFFPRLSVLAERLWNAQDLASVEERRASLETKLRALDINLYRGNSY